MKTILSFLLLGCLAMAPKTFAATELWQSPVTSNTLELKIVEPMQSPPNAPVIIYLKNLAAPRIGPVALRSFTGQHPGRQLGSGRIGQCQRDNAFRSHVAGGHDGTVMELDARTGLFRSGKLGVGIQLQADWSSRDYMRAYYGVTLAESVETHLPVYSPKAGFRDVMPSIAAQYQFNRHWAAVGTIQYIHLLGDAADSPVPRTRGAGGRTNVGAFVVYTF